MTERHEPLLRKQRLVLVIPSLNYGGVETRLVLQARRMASMLGELRVCTFVDDGEAAREIRAADVPVDVLGVDPNIRNPVATYRLLRYLRQHRPSIVHARIGPANVHTAVAGALARVPVRIVEEVGIGTRGWLGGCVVPKLFRLAHHVIGVSDAVAISLRREGVGSDRVVRIYNAIDDSFFAIVGTRPSAHFRIVAVGRLVEEKGHAVLVRAVAQLVRQGRPVRLLIAGEGRQRVALEALIRELGIASHVELLGYRADIGDLLANADLFVLPSLSEGFGLAVVEAMAARVPVIASRVGGVPEVMGAIAGEWLVEAGNEEELQSAIDRILMLDQDRRAELGKNLHIYARERFTSDRYIADLGRFYADAVRRTGSVG